MEKVSTSERLNYIMSRRNLKQIDILHLTYPFCQRYNVKMGKSDISQYVNGKVEPSQEKLVILGMALDVAESWLMGFDVPMERTTSNLSPLEKEIITKYRQADSTTKSMVHRVLFIDEEKEGTA